MQVRQQQQEAEKGAEAGADLGILAAAASVGLAQYLFFVRGQKELGIFVGLWPPTILTITNHFKQREFEQRIKMIPKGPASLNVRERFEDMLQSSS